MPAHQENAGAVDQEMQDVVAGVDIDAVEEEYAEPQRIRVVSISLPEVTEDAS